jgi:hypothetical protein
MAWCLVKCKETLPLPLPLMLGERSFSSLALLLHSLSNDSMLSLTKDAMLKFPSSSDESSSDAGQFGLPTLCGGFDIFIFAVNITVRGRCLFKNNVTQSLLGTLL